MWTACFFLRRKSKLKGKMSVSHFSVVPPQEVSKKNFQFFFRGIGGKPPTSKKAECVPLGIACRYLRPENRRTNLRKK